MKVVVSSDVNGVKIRREFEVKRNYAFRPFLDPHTVGYINDLLNVHKDIDFVIHLAFRHELSVPDLFDKFNCIEV